MCLVRKMCSVSEPPGTGLGNTGLCIIEYEFTMDNSTFTKLT